ncbi:hypothetical protein J6590_029302 [Homalodisca vitripennis]|nr:hypothetical protein J6590_029302 [Homalodisca vitripennis]
MLLTNFGPLCAGQRSDLINTEDTVRHKLDAGTATATVTPPPPYSSVFEQTVRRHLLPHPSHIQPTKKLSNVDKNKSKLQIFLKGPPKPEVNVLPMKYLGKSAVEKRVRADIKQQLRVICQSVKSQMDGISQ